MVSAQAAIGDVVAPSQRGKYSGLFGAVFGVSSVAGPLIGGFLTTHISWRFIFYVNLPLGVLALAVLAVALPDPGERTRRAIDWAGTLTLALGLSAIILMTTLGGTSYDWGSPEIVAMGVVGVLAIVAFALVERRAAEPILPPALFGNRVFVVCSGVGLIVGFGLFGALTYLPLFQQVVRGLSPTASGLQLLPVMGGLLVSSIVAGQVITRTGRYKAFPVAGTAVAALGMYLLSSLDASTPSGVAALHMLVLGLGLGMVMQVLVLATQNSVPYRLLGVATSGATLFRSIGGSLGTAVLGAIFTNQLTSALPDGATPRDPGYIPAFVDALDLVFLVATGILLLAFALTWFIREMPLRQTVETSAGLGESLGAPVDTDSLREVTRGLTRLVGRERTLVFLEDATRRAGVELAPGAAWLLLVLGRPEPPTLAEIRATGVPAERLDAALAHLREHGAVTAGGEVALTDDGTTLRERLVAARTDGLRALVADWEPDEHPELDPLVARLARELEPPVPTATA